MPNLTRVGNNCDRRRTSTVGGSHNTSNAGTFEAGVASTVASVPSNSVITGIRVVGKHLNAAADIEVTVGTTALTAVSLTTNDSVASVTTSDIMTTANTAINIKTSVEQTVGEVIVLVDFIEINTVTGLKTEPVVRG